MKKIVVVLSLFTILVLYGSLAGCTNAGREVPTPTPLPVIVAQEKVVFTVQRGPITAQREAYGEVAPAWQESLFFRASGYITRVVVKEGDQVKQGDLLAEMQVDDLLDQLEQARLDLQAAQDEAKNQALQRAYEQQKAASDVVILQVQVAQAERLLERVVGTQKTDAQDALTILQERLKVAEAWQAAMQSEQDSASQASVERSQLAVDRLERLVSERQIVAPYDCVILDSYVRPGTDFEAFNTGFVVGDPAKLVIRIAFDNELANLLEPATVAYMSLTRTKEKLYPVSFLPNFLPVSNKKSGLDVSGSDVKLNYLYFSTPTELIEQLPLGGGVTVVMVLGQKEDVLLLPPAAIRGNDTFKYVIVLGGDASGTAAHRRVEVVSVGLRGDKLWEINADLNEGDQVLGP